MSPLLIPLIQGAVDILKDKKAFKENLKSKTSIGAYAAIGAAGMVAANPDFTPDGLEPALTQIALGAVALVMFFIRKKQ